MDADDIRSDRALPPQSKHPLQIGCSDGSSDPTRAAPVRQMFWIPSVEEPHILVGLGHRLDAKGIPAAAVSGTTDEQAIGDKVRVIDHAPARRAWNTAPGAIRRASNTWLSPRWIKQLDDDAHDAAFARERGLLYVSGSHARQHLYVSWTGRPFELLNLPT